MNALIGCQSTGSDREYNAVVIDLGDLFVRELENRRHAFDQTLKIDSGLYCHEYHCVQVSLPEVQEATLSKPGGLVALAPLLKDLDNPDVTFIRPEILFLVVVEDGFFFEFDADDSWGEHHLILYRPVFTGRC